MSTPPTRDMMKSISLSILNISSIIISFITSLCFVVWDFKQPESMGLWKLTMLVIVSFLLGYMSPRILSPLKTVADVIAWKLFGYKQTNYAFWFLIKKEGMINLSSNLYLIYETFFPKRFIDSINVDVHTRIKMVRRIEAVKHVIMIMLYVCIALIFLSCLRMPFFMIPIVGGIIDVLTANLDMPIFKGSFARLRYGELFDYYIIRQALSEDAISHDVLIRFVESEKENYDNDCLEMERITIWEEVIVKCCVSGCNLPEDADFILQNKYFNVTWKMYVTSEVLNLFKLYMSYALIYKKENELKIALNMLKRWKAEELGTSLKTEIERVIKCFQNKEGIDSTFIKSIFYYEDFKLNRLEIHKLRNLLGDANK